MATSILESYASAVRATVKSGAATDERSHYPALKDLLSRLGALTDPKVRAESDPAGVGGAFPDLAVIEMPTNVLVLPVEAKPPSWTIDAILKQAKTATYAASFGGGRVMVTNIHTFALAGLDGSGNLSVLADIEVLDPTKLDDPRVPPIATDDELAALLDYGTELRTTISRPQTVAKHLADHAGAMRDLIVSAGDAKDLLRPIWDLFESGLGTELEDEFFVPTVVQTLVYGLFAGWLNSEEDPTDFDWQSASYRVDVPLFADVLHASLRPYLIRRCDLFPRLAAVAGVLRRVDREAFTKALSGGAIEYFYEPFLAEYDPELRDRLGVWYTPSEVADYQVASCDHQLRVHLGIEEGLADKSVIILDPAVGTGTYLSAVYRFIYERNVLNGEPNTVAASRAKEAALSRVIGFEILPAAFIVAHLALGQTLRNLGAPLHDTERIRVYLTNSLTGWDPSKNLPTTTLFPELDDELEEARKVKQQEPVLVVLGNPPYEGYSSAESDEERELIRPWIEPLSSKWGLRKHRLNDLYARFWAAAIQRIELTGRGVVSFITNSQWLMGRSYPEMRLTVLNSFDRVHVTDLHGDVHDRTHPGDQSIFTTSIASGIRVGTAIVTATRIDAQTTPATVTASDLRGSADDKRAELLGLRADPERGSVPIKVSQEGKWRFSSHPGTDFPHLDDYFVVNDNGDSHFSGVQPGRNGVATDRDQFKLESRIRDYFDASVPFADLVDRHPDFGIRQARYDPPEVRRKLLSRAASVQTGGFQKSRMHRFLFRPMEARWIYWETEHKFLTEARAQMTPFWSIAEQRALVAPQTPRRAGAKRPIVSTQVPCNECVDPNARVFPLWRPDVLAAAGGTSVASRQPAIEAQWIDAARSAGSTGSDEEIAETIFYAIAGVGLSPEWLASQEQDSDDLPSIPIPATPSDLAAAAEVGRKYADLVDPDVAVSGVTSGAIAPQLKDFGVPDNVQGDITLVKGSFGRVGGDRVGEDVLWDDDHGWRGVPSDVWEFTLGGFSVLSKWLSYRVDQPLSVLDREEFMYLVRRIKAILLLMPEADTVYSSALKDPLQA